MSPRPLELLSRRAAEVPWDEDDDECARGSPDPSSAGKGWCGAAAAAVDMFKRRPSLLRGTGRRCTVGQFEFDETRADGGHGLGREPWYFGADDGYNGGLGSNLTILSGGFNQIALAKFFFPFPPPTTREQRRSRREARTGAAVQGPTRGVSTVHRPASQSRQCLCVSLVGR